MSVRVRLQRRGRKKHPIYNIVIADARAKRDGRFIEKLGTYNPNLKPGQIEINQQRTIKWLMQGAQPTETVQNILSHLGIMYKKHLQRGVQKKSITQAVADNNFATWQKQHKNKKRPYIYKPAPALKEQTKPILQEQTEKPQNVQNTTNSNVAKTTKTTETPVQKEQQTQKSTVKTAK